MFSLLKRNSDRNESLRFYLFVLVFLIAAIVFYDRPQIAMWIGFGLAGYSAIANDSIQTLGTFIASNNKMKWWILWIFVGGILVSVLAYSWYTHAGDISYERLSKIPEATEYSFLHLLAPLSLLLLTRFKMPVSTTFLLLSVFSSTSTIASMLEKTFISYFIAFGSALIIWAIVAELMKKKIAFHGKYNKSVWRVLQWITTGYLWVSWLMHDIANTAVFLPRSLSFTQMAIVCGFLFVCMGFLLYIKGGRIQQIITEKTDVVDIRAATLIDFVYGTILLIFKEWNSLPMSTTWVFLGMLAGREVAMAQISGKDKPYTRTLGLVMKDLALASIGLVISIVLALLVNSEFNLNDLVGIFGFISF